MSITATFELPAETIHGLADGTLVRVGGVIRDTTSKRIVQHLREASLRPQALGDAVAAPMRTLMGFGSIASILNLGATVGFGVATMTKLRQIEGTLGVIKGKLDAIDKKLDAVSWTVECVYEASRQIFDRVEGIQALIEDGIKAGLDAALDSAIKAQAREPGHPERDRLFTLANDRATHSSAWLRRKSQRELEAAAKQLSRRETKWHDRKSYRDLDGKALSSMVEALRGLRFTLGALSLKSLIGADAGFLREEITNLKASTEEVGEMLRSLGHAFFRPKGFVAYDYFLNRYFGAECAEPMRRITATRLARLASKIDPDVPDVDALITVLQGIETHDSHSLNERRDDWEKWILPMSTAFYELEMAFEDFDRLEGHLAELEFCHVQGYSIQEYRSRLEVNELPENGKLVFLGFAAEAPDAASF